MIKYKEELKIIDTPDKAYLLGFFYGDGCITEYYDRNRKRYSSKISISVKDGDLLKKLNKIFPFFRLGVFNYSKYNINSSKQIYISSTSENLFNDLKSNGLYVRKSYNNKEMLSITDINKTLIHHFIRGFFDADGSVYKIKNRNNLIRISITSNSKNFINQVNDLLKEQNIFSWKIIEKQPTGKGKQVYYDLSIIKREDVLKFSNYIYDKTTIHLPRKKKIFDEFRIVDKVSERNIFCPKCNSKNCTKNGVRKRKNDLGIRMECNDCQKGFTIKNPCNQVLFISQRL